MSLRTIAVGGGEEGGGFINSDESVGALMERR